MGNLMRAVHCIDRHVNCTNPLTVLISVWTERQKNDIILKDLLVLRQSDLFPDDALARV